MSRHDYGEEDGEDDPEVDDSTGARELLSSSAVSGPDRAVIIASKKRCKCGSTTHLRTSHHECPMYKNKKKSKRHEDDSVDSIGNSTSEQGSTTKKCKCGSTSHLRISHRDCPMKKGKTGK